jgi:hypothetical protein
MLHKLISHSPDLQKLVDEGFEVEIRPGHLLIHSVPYVNSKKEIKRGTLISELTIRNDTATGKPQIHVVYFQGEYPCTAQGIPIEQIRHMSENRNLGSGIEINHSFSNKLSTNYEDYYNKMTQYIKIISHPANALDSSADARTFKPIECAEDDSVFNYMDTASSRAGIMGISEKFSSQRIAIVGLGGTGSYILDLVAKTPVQEIHLFDADAFLPHNAFRAPGAASIDDLRSGKMKVDYFTEIYSKMRNGIIPHAIMITKENLSNLTGFDYLFLCVDDGPCKKAIFEALINTNTIIIDTGIDVKIANERLFGVCRVTSVTKTKNNHINARISMTENIEDDGYNSNIQIAELNSICACYAVIKWKQFSGFYQDIENAYHLTYSTNCALLTSDENVQ